MCGLLPFSPKHSNQPLPRFLSMQQTTGDNLHIAGSSEQVCLEDLVGLNHSVASDTR